MVERRMTPDMRIAAGVVYGGGAIDTGGVSEEFLALLAMVDAAERMATLVELAQIADVAIEVGHEVAREKGC